MPTVLSLNMASWLAMINAPLYDASASRKRYDLSTFFIRRIFPGNGTVLCLQDYLTAVAQSPFELIGVRNDRHNYELTTRP